MIILHDTRSILTHQVPVLISASESRTARSLSMIAQVLPSSFSGNQNKNTITTLSNLGLQQVHGNGGKLGSKQAYTREARCTVKPELSRPVPALLMPLIIS
jgi:hypothetical protein